MLILLLHDGQTVKIGDNVLFKFFYKIGGVYKVGFEAPKEIRILRDNAVVRTRKDKIETSSSSNALCKTDTLTFCNAKGKPF